MKSDTPQREACSTAAGAPVAHERTEAARCPHPDTFWFCHGCDKPPDPSAGVSRPWQAWPLSDCSSRWHDDWPIARPPAFLKLSPPLFANADRLPQHAKIHWCVQVFVHIAFIVLVPGRQRGTVGIKTQGKKKKTLWPTWKYLQSNLKSDQRMSSSFNSTHFS